MPFPYFFRGFQYVTRSNNYVYHFDNFVPVVVFAATAVNVVNKYVNNDKQILASQMSPVALGKRLLCS
jgi:hypothetical protein